MLHVEKEVFTESLHTVFRTMVSQLLRHERIETTVAKAKELKRLADKVVTIAKEVSAAARMIHAPPT